MIVSTPLPAADPQITQIAKPTEWSSYLVNGTVAIQSDCSTWSETWDRNPENAKMAVFTALTTLEHKKQYQWPDFSALGFDFSNVMRLRRALVTDLTLALSKSAEFRAVIKKRKSQSEPPEEESYPSPCCGRRSLGKSSTRAETPASSPCEHVDTPSPSVTWDDIGYPKGTNRTRDVHTELLSLFEVKSPSEIDGAGPALTPKDAAKSLHIQITRAVISNMKRKEQPKQGGSFTSEVAPESNVLGLSSDIETPPRKRVKTRRPSSGAEKSRFEEPESFMMV